MLALFIINWSSAWWTLPNLATFRIICRKSLDKNLTSRLSWIMLQFLRRAKMGYGNYLIKNFRHTPQCWTLSRTPSALLNLPWRLCWPKEWPKFWIVVLLLMPIFRWLLNRCNILQAIIVSSIENHQWSQKKNAELAQSCDRFCSCLPKPGQHHRVNCSIKSFFENVSFHSFCPTCFAKNTYTMRIWFTMHIWLTLCRIWFTMHIWLTLCRIWFTRLLVLSTWKTLCRISKQCIAFDFISSHYFLLHHICFLYVAFALPRVTFDVENLYVLD